METVTIEIPKTYVLADVTLTLEKEMEDKMRFLQRLLESADAEEYDTAIKALCFEIDVYKVLISKLCSVW